jgi:hypothetical protein
MRVRERPGANHVRGYVSFTQAGAELFASSEPQKERLAGLWRFISEKSFGACHVPVADRRV